ncbi:MAG: hypothetical protein IPK83_09680 [Planctomycetes bacterium]|nr:hypothetical protein [Planctomycetota bacterium]
MIQTKIVATLGPATDSVETLTALINAGVDVFRLNFSHGKLEQHAKTLANIRTACESTGSMAAVLGDLCGPKIRIDPVENDAFLIANGANRHRRRPPHRQRRAHLHQSPRADPRSRRRPSRLDRRWGRATARR